MLLDQERLPKRPPPLPPPQGNSKAPAGSEFTASSNGSHLFGCHGSTGEPRGCGRAGQARAGEGGEAGFSKHLTRQEKKTAPQASVSGMSTTHGHSLTHHTHVTTTRVYPRFRPGARSRYRCLLLSLWRGGPRGAAPFPRENAEGRKNSGNNKHGHRGRTACCLFSFACHTNFFPSASWLSALTPRLHLRLELLRPGRCPSGQVVL